MKHLVYIKANIFVVSYVYSKKYYLNNKLHRAYGPAEVYNVKDGNNQYFAWYKNGKLHRVNGPAFIDSILKIKYWYKNGKRHREDGPAVEWNDGGEWWFNNKQISCTSDKEYFNLIKYKAFW